MRRIALHLLALLLAAAAGAGCGGSDADGERADGERAGGSYATTPAVTTSVETAAADGRQANAGELPRVRLVATPGLALGAAERARAVSAAQRFGVSLTRWLYGDRDRLAVEPISAALRLELQSAPPYIPADQRGSGEGRVEALELALQTARSGVVTVIVNDLRTSYRIPAALELRGGCWLIVDLHDH